MYCNKHVLQKHEIDSDTNFFDIVTWILQGITFQS